MQIDILLVCVFHFKKYFYKLNLIYCLQFNIFSIYVFIMRNLKNYNFRKSDLLIKCYIREYINNT